MSVFNMEIKSEYLDTTQHSNNRSEFRLPADRLYLSDMKVLNVGCRSTDVANQYNFLVGSYGVISKISLLDGSVVIDEVPKFNIVAGFKNKNHKNWENKDLRKELSRHNLGYSYQGTATDSVEISKIQHFQPYDENLTNNEETTPVGYLALREVFGFLKNSQYVSTTMMKKLRVVIEYESSADVKQAGNVAGVKNQVQPTLSAVYVDNEEEHQAYLKGFKGVEYMSLETDQVQLPENAVLIPGGTADQEKNFRVRGFDKKFVGRVFMTKNAPKGNLNVSEKYKRLGSEAQFKEHTNVVVNGKNLFTEEGITKPNQRLGLLHQTWGTMNTVVGENIPDFTDSVNSVEDNEDIVSHYDVLGFDLSRRVADLQINYKRTSCQGQAKTEMPLQMNVFGEVMKQVAPSNGSYVVQYL